MPDIPPGSDGLLTWLFAGVAAIVSTLAAVIGVLYRAAETRNARELAELKERVDGLDTKLDTSEAGRLECEKDRAMLKGECALLKTRIEVLEKRRS